MSALEAFPALPSSNSVTVCETNSELVVHWTSAGSTDDIQCQQYYSNVNLSRELLKPSRSNESAQSAFRECEDTARTRLLWAWQEHGVTGILEVLSLYESHSKGHQVLAYIARPLLAAIRWSSALNRPIFWHLAMSSENLISEFSTNPTWAGGLVRCFAWHPHAPKFAVALRDDAVSIHNAARPADIVPTLKHKLQKAVADLAWRPMSASILAVACQSCILVWTVEPQSLATRPSASCAQVLSRPGHCPVISLAWSPLDCTLVSASPNDNAIMVWDISMETSVPLKRFGSGGITMLRWSPEGSKLFTACPSTIFRVWECQTWTCENWTKLLGRCQCACWSPDGNTMLFSTTEDATIYSISFHKCVAGDGQTNITGCTSAMTAINLQSIVRPVDDGPINMGGPPQAMIWDQHGERLAVLFKGSAAAFVAVFQTRLLPSFEVIAVGFVRGYKDELATIISFKPNFENGSLLTVVWSSGRISHIPLNYVPRKIIGRSHEIVPARVPRGNFTQLGTTFSSGRSATTH